MTRTQLACYSLLASAFILAALLLVNLPKLSQAYASESVVTPDYSFTTATTQPDNESLFVLDSVNHIVLIYDLEVRGSDKRITLKNGYDVKRLLDDRNILGQ